MHEFFLRRGKREDLPRLCRIWALSFGDEEALVRQVLDGCGVLAGTVVCENAGRVCGMMTAFDGLRVEGKSASYLYALCTHPDHRGRGIGEALTRESARLAFERGNELACLHPASASLARWYERLGFVPAASPEEEEILPKASRDLELTALSPEEYLRRRRAFGAEEIPLTLLRVQALFCRASGGGLFAAKLAGREGLVCAERQGQALMLREVLCEASLAAPLAAAVTARLGSVLGRYRGGKGEARLASPPQLMLLAKEQGTLPRQAHLPFLLD